MGGIRESSMGRDENDRAARGYKAACGYWRKLIMRFRIHIVEVAKESQLIVADLRFESRIPAPALLLRIRA